MISKTIVLTWYGSVLAYFWVFFSMHLLRLEYQVPRFQNLHVTKLTCHLILPCKNSVASSPEWVADRSMRVAILNLTTPLLDDDEDHSLDSWLVGSIFLGTGTRSPKQCASMICQGRRLCRPAPDHLPGLDPAGGAAQGYWQSSWVEGQQGTGRHTFDRYYWVAFSRGACTNAHRPHISQTLGQERTIFSSAIVHAPPSTKADLLYTIPDSGKQGEWRLGMDKESGQLFSVRERRQSDKLGPNTYKSVFKVEFSLLYVSHIDVDMSSASNHPISVLLRYAFYNCRFVMKTSHS